MALFLLLLRRGLLLGGLLGGFLLCLWHVTTPHNVLSGFSATNRPPSKRKQYEGLAFDIASIAGFSKNAEKAEVS